MTDHLWTLITLILGAGLALLGGWLESIRSRKWKIEDSKRNRELTAKDYWLGRIEEIAESAIKEFHTTWQMANNIIFSTSKAELEKAQNNIQIHIKYEYSDQVKSVLARTQSIHVFGNEILSESYLELIKIIEKI